MKSTCNISVPVYMLVGAIGVLSFVFLLNCVPMGDDLYYASSFAGARPDYESWWQYPLWAVRHYLYVNGRWGNYVLPVLTILPAVLRAAIASTMIAAMYLIAIRCSGARRGWVQVLLCAAISLTMPWWDSFVLLACQTNYVWASVTLLASYYLFFNKGQDIKWWYYPILFLGGCSHEAGSLPLLCGAVMYWFINRPRFTRRDFRLMFVFLAGVAVVISPGLLRRVGGGSVEDDPLIPFLLKTDAVAVSLWIIVAVGLIFKSSRITVKSLLSSPESILFWATFGVVFISVYGGITGRSGWFGQLYALIFIARWLNRYDYLKLKWLGWLMAWITVTQLTVSAIYQCSLGSEYKEFVEEYRRSPDGIVEWTTTPDDTLPWFTLARCRGIVDYDDIYLITSLRRFHRTDDCIPIAVPDIPTDDFMELSKFPADAWWSTSPSEDVNCAYFNHNGQLWVAIPSGNHYYAQRAVIDPGDRHHIKR